MRKTLLFDPFPAQGHVNAMLRLANKLGESDHIIIFIGHIEFAEKVRSAGYNYYIVDSFILIPEIKEIEDRGLSGFVIGNIFKPRFKRLERELESKSLIYDGMMNALNPDLIFLDDYYPDKAFFYSKYGLPIVNIQTMLLPLRDKQIPPFQSGIIPSNSFLSYFSINIAWSWNKIFRDAMRIYSRLLTMGQTNLRFLQKWFSDSGYTISRYRCFGLGIEEIQTLNLTPKSFDFPREKTGLNIFHFGYYPSANGEKIEDGRLARLLDHHQTDISDNKHLLVYCSLGTVTTQFQQRSTRFFNVILKVAVLYPNYRFVLSVGKEFDISKLMHKPSNVGIFTHVPQQSLLPHVDIMITHGGFNTIRECIQAEVPMLVYPLTNKWDQPGNSARVVFHKIGLQGNIRKINTRSLKSKIEGMKIQRNEFKKNLHSMRKRIENQQTDEIKVIQNVIHTLTNEHNPDPITMQSLGN